MSLSVVVTCHQTCHWGLSIAFLVKEASGTCCPLQDLEGVGSCWLLLQLAHSASHSKVSTTLPRPGGCAESRPAWAGFTRRRLPCPRPLAVPRRAGGTTFFRLDFCLCSSVPGGLSEGLGRPRSQDLGAAEQRASGVCVPHSGTSEPSRPSSYLATGSLPSSVSSLGPSMPIQQVRGSVNLDLRQNHLAAY